MKNLCGAKIDLVKSNVTFRGLSWLVLGIQDVFTGSSVRYMKKPMVVPNLTLAQHVKVKSNIVNPEKTCCTFFLTS